MSDETKNDAAEPAGEMQARPGRAAHLAQHQFKPGQSGNPTGRAKGSRNKLSEAFVEALFDDFNKAVIEGGPSQGAEAIAKVRADDPTNYLKVIVALAPKHVHVKEDVLDACDDDELTAALAAIRAIRQARSDGAQDRGEDPAPDGSKPH
jgi:Family of unknown function (DUF5681)